eukprot:COSAG04_NODE_372_length_15668_cov_11.135975_9_plen_376_part_00
MKRTEVLVLLLSKEVMTRPWCLLEIHTALTYGVPIVPVQLQHPDYGWTGTSPPKWPSMEELNSLCEGKGLDQWLSYFPTEPPELQAYTDALRAKLRGYPMLRYDAQAPQGVRQALDEELTRRIRAAGKAKRPGKVRGYKGDLLQRFRTAGHAVRSAIRLQRHSAFFSLRFGDAHGVEPMAKELQAALKAKGVYAKIVDMQADGNIKKEVFSQIEACSTFVAFGSKHYGEDTGNSASTCKESEYVEGLTGANKKKIIRIRMIPFDEQFEHLQGRTFFGMNDMTEPWMVGEPMPPDLPGKIVAAMKIDEQQMEEDDPVAQVQAVEKQRQLLAETAKASPASGPVRMESASSLPGTQSVDSIEERVNNSGRVNADLLG